MPIFTNCICGRRLKVNEGLAGRKIRCPKCQSVVSVPKPNLQSEREDEALDILLSDAPVDRSPPAANANAITSHMDAEPRRQPPTPPAAAAPSPIKHATGPSIKKRKKPRRDDDYGDSGFQIYVNPSIITGLLMMLGATIWFIAGLALLDVIYIYPPILFVLGIGAIIRGFTVGGD